MIWSQPFDSKAKDGYYPKYRRKFIRSETLSLLARMTNSKFLGIPYSVRRLRHPKYGITYKSVLKGGTVKVTNDFFEYDYKRARHLRLRGFSKGSYVMKPSNLKPAENKYLKFCGFTPKSVMYMPSKHIPLDVILKRAIYHSTKKIKDGKLRSVCQSSLLKSRYMVSGGIETSYSHLEKYYETPRNKGFSAEQHLELLEKTKKQLIRLPIIHDLNSDMLDSIRINEESHPGFFTSLIYGGSKRRSYSACLNFAKHLLEMSYKFPLKYIGLYELSGRGKDINLEKNDGETALTRIIMIPEFPIVIITSAIAQMIGSFIAEDDHNAIFIGKDLSSKTDLFIKHFDRYAFNGDWSTFDASLDEETILAAVSLVRSCFPIDRKYDRLFFMISTSLINKHVVFPKGVVYEVKKGLPSGHPLTSLVETICNILIWNRINWEVWEGDPSDHVDGKYGGDDSFHTTEWNPRYLDITNIALHHCNQNFSESPIDRFALQFMPKPDLNPDFLKRQILEDGTVQWRIDLISRKMIHPEWQSDSPSEKLTKLYNYIRTCPGNGEYRDFMTRNVLYTHKLCRPDQRSSQEEEVLKHVEGIINEAQSRNLKKRIEVLKPFDMILNTEKWIESMVTTKYFFRPNTLEEQLLLHAINIQKTNQPAIKKGIVSTYVQLTRINKILPNSKPMIKHWDVGTFKYFLNKVLRPKCLVLRPKVKDKLIEDFIVKSNGIRTVTLPFV